VDCQGIGRKDLQERAPGIIAGNIREREVCEKESGGKKALPWRGVTGEKN